MASKKAIDRAGKYLREWWNAPLGEEDETGLPEALSLVSDWRSGHQHPLVLVNNGLRQFIRTEGDGPILVSQRLKRVPTIIDKLARHENMQITQMQDIAGCRAILPDQANATAVLNRIAHRWTVRGEVDNYAARPAHTGYRAIHVVVVREERMIEIQLRTRPQHAWAAAVERASGLDPTLHRIKDGIGPQPVVDYFRAASDILALQEAQMPVDDDTVRLFVELREAARALHPGVLLGA